MNTRLLTASVFAALVSSLLMLPASVQASNIFKCVNDAGETSYSQTACGESVQILVAVRGNDSANDRYSCQIAKRFVHAIADKMRSGTPSGELFRSYGGMDSLQSSALALINYVYTYQNNYLATSERIAALAGTRCSAGSFGPVTCNNLPYSFTNEIGGCVATSTTAQHKRKPGPTTLSQLDD